jgi:predicted RND superfamily exporter protein
MDVRGSRIRFDVGQAVLRHRVIIGLGLVLVSAFMALGAAKVQIATRFVDFFPRAHPNVRLYDTFAKEFGGAQGIVFMIEVEHGDILNISTLSIIRDVTHAVARLPGVDHQSIRSLASYRVTYSTVIQGGLQTKAYMFPSVPKTPEELATLKAAVLAHQTDLKSLVSPDNRSALVTATFYEGALDYRKLFARIEAIVDKYQDANHRIYLAGEPIVRGYGYRNLRTIAIIALISIGLMLVLLYVSLRERSTWWSPVITGSLSALWGLGFVGWMGYNFDPAMLVIPLILTARDLSHGIQWQGRYYNELDRTADKYRACVATTNLMLPPGLLSIVVDIAGIVFVSLGGIPVLKYVGLSGAVWLASSLLMVFIFQPILMSYLPTPKVRMKARRANGGGAISHVLNTIAAVPARSGALRGAVLAASGIFVVLGIVFARGTKIGYSSVGTPLYRPGEKVNLDMVQISHKFPTDEAWVVVRAPDRYPGPTNAITPAVLRMADDLRQYLLLRDPNVVQVSSLASTFEKPLNQALHDDFPKYLAIPHDLLTAGNLWSMFLGGTAPGEGKRWGDDENTRMCIRIQLHGHSYDSLNTLQEELADFRETRVVPDHALAGVQFLFLGGAAGLYAAANDVLFRLDIINIVFVLAIVLIGSGLEFGSITAGVLFVMACVLANFAAFIYLRVRGIGLSIDTIPVISLGIGLGIDYGIYTVARIKDEVASGLSIPEAVSTGTRATGAAVFTTFVVMVGGIIPWAFSPMLFHNNMSILLTFLMCTNMIAGVIVLPAYIAWARPRFVRRYEATVEDRSAHSREVTAA